MTVTQPSPRVRVIGYPTTSQRWRPSAPFLAAGSVAIVAGGLAAAVTGPTNWDHGSWVAAFLVLVTGVAQIGIGAAQAQLAPFASSIRFAARQCVLWNAGCLAVIAGTLLSNPLTVSVGGGLLLAALGMSAYAVRGAGDQVVLRGLYRALLIVLLASIPIGIALAWTRH